ncbi:MAG: signal peptidase I [Clostridia bacterium]|nr:signal peptidase I [Clostridia bacterium]
MSENKNKSKDQSMTAAIFEIVEMFATVTVVVLVAFAFIMRLNIVDGESMEETLHHGEYLAVSDLFYEPEYGDIVIIHDISAFPYNNPIVKRVIATEGQTVDIDFETWTLTVDGKVIEEDYRCLKPDTFLAADYSFPITVPENEIFVLGDNRNHSADSRQIEIGTVDKRCVVGKAVARLSPMNKFTIFN